MIDVQAEVDAICEHYVNAAISDVTLKLEDELFEARTKGVSARRASRFSFFHSFWNRGLLAISAAVAILFRFLAIVTSASIARIRAP
jgi:hypothetical protein